MTIGKEAGPAAPEVSGQSSSRNGDVICWIEVTTDELDVSHTNLAEIGGRFPINPYPALYTGRITVQVTDSVGNTAVRDYYYEGCKGSNTDPFREEDFLPCFEFVRGFMNTGEYNLVMIPFGYAPLTYQEEDVFDLRNNGYGFTDMSEVEIFLEGPDADKFDWYSVHHNREIRTSFPSGRRSDFLFLSKISRICDTHSPGAPA